MNDKEKLAYKNLAKELVTPERFSGVQLVAELATVSTLFPDLPQAAIHYFPQRPEDLGA